MVKQTSSQPVRLHPQRFHCQLRSSQRWQKSSDQINKQQGLLSVLSTTCPFPPSSIVPQKHKNTNYTVSHYHYSIFLPSALGYYTEWNSSKNKQTAPSKLFPQIFVSGEPNKKINKGQGCTSGFFFKSLCLQQNFDTGEF